MQERLKTLKADAWQDITAVKDSKELDEVRVRYLGRKGELTGLLRGMGQLPAEERPTVGRLVNELRSELESSLEAKREALEQEELEQSLKSEMLDISLPGRQPGRGHIHPLNLVLDEIKQLFISMGFQVVEGPEVETDYYNFEALNLPPDHPTRDMQDTFFVSKDILLRSQTSPVQIRVMENQKPPVRIIAPGKVYRVDDLDATHTPMFHQVEGLLIDESATFGDLKGLLNVFIEAMFGKGRKIRFRPSFFPFTEPSAEVDVECIMCSGAGCRVCSQTGWLEILGSGMVDPRVLQIVGYDPERYQGLAFGVGVERIAMLKYGIADIRLLFENDLRFLGQFK
ncbi:MAG: phenylalanine--tRNA ligase subunit alpha [Firmicutes bacterium]|nr:phenylalanine--tRNA ligase subunit alpha [Bacillota bacterium]